MFDDIGGKIKTLAKITCGLGIAASIIGAIALWMQNSNYNPTTIIGVLVLVLGSLASWIGSFFTYGFGQLIENTNTIHSDNLKIQELLRNQKKKMQVQRLRLILRARPNSSLSNHFILTMNGNVLSVECEIPNARIVA
ncbi:MAG: hypothetical protein ACLUHE_11880 [Christensenellales bacterium]